jgi:integrase
LGLQIELYQKDVQEWMGHSDIKMTANIYSHLDVSRKMNIADSIAGSFSE